VLIGVMNAHTKSERRGPKYSKNDSLDRHLARGCNLDSFHLNDCNCKIPQHTAILGTEQQHNDLGSVDLIAKWSLNQF